MKIYVSHPIRGIRENPSPAYITHNRLMAQIFGAALRIRYPQHEFYVPAEHEEFVQAAYDNPYLSINQILDIDCKIIDVKDGVIFYNHERMFSGGMKTEHAYAINTNKPKMVIISLSLIVELPELEGLLRCN